jgi:peptidoglycan/LPS O-acetylase OafA/YrhL
LHFVLDFPRPIFIKTWYLFALGVLVYWTMMRLVPSFILLAILAVLAGTAAVQNDQQMFAGAATGAVIYLAALRGGLSRWLGGPVLQYFGRISYSLYLVHFNVAADVFRVGRHITGGGDPGDAFWFLTSMAAAIGVAHVLNKYIERPSMNLASRFKPRPAPRATAPSPTAAANPPADSPANTPPARTPVAP